MDAIDKQIESNRRLAAQLLKLHEGRYPSWEQERARLRLEAERRQREQAEHEAALAAVREEQAKAHEETQKLPGITMPPREERRCVDPIDGSTVQF